MISRAAQADVALLVISARKDEFETGFEKGGQTCEQDRWRERGHRPDKQDG
jgi:translation elongation factor EF-1alpha